MGQKRSKKRSKSELLNKVLFDYQCVRVVRGGSGGACGARSGAAAFNNQEKTKLPMTSDTLLHF